MKGKFVSLLLLVLFSISVLTAFSTQDKKSPKDLPERYKKWLTEEVVYIISPKEKEVFLQLETDREREVFIEAFWKIRDPNPNTPENEFMKEHYRRIKYANQYFGKESPGEGWRSDMGRIYIVLREPNSIDRFLNHSEIYPTIIWHYSGKAEYGLPNSFYVVFFKKSGIGEFELYSPVKFGPQSLVIHYKGDMTDYLSAYSQLRRIEPTVAAVSLSLIPGETALSPSPSIASEILVVNKIPSAAYHKVKDTYAEKLLMYKDFVEVEYTANYIDNDFEMRIIQDKAGISFIHYLIEPKKLTFEKIGNKFISNLEVYGKISDLEGNTVYQYQKTIPIEFDREQLNNIKAKLFSFQDMFPLIEGNYKLNILLKNTVSKEFTSIEKDFFVSPPFSFQISPLILGNKIINNSEYIGKNKPFLIEDIQLVPSPRNDFSQGDRLYLYFQIHGLPDSLRERGRLEYSILKDGDKVYSLVKNIKDYPDRENFFEEFSLSDFPPAYYKIKVSLLDEGKKEILFEQSDFFISYLPSLPRPWILSLPQPSSEDPMYANILGNQLLNKKDMAKAMRLLGDAYHKAPTSKKFALDFCRILFLHKDYQKVKEFASPFLEDEQKYEFLSIVGQASQALGELAEAIAYYKEHLAHYGANLYVLNAIGDCYYRLGDIEEALIAYEKSLELNSKQERIRKIVKILKEKK
jgi:GWxTD domain-containing protein